MTDSYAPPDSPPRIVHADASLLVVDKPAGLLTVPGRGPDKTDCLIARLREEYPSVLLVHRLDRDTSGLVIFAVTPQAQAHLGQQFEGRVVEKSYVARVQGVPAQAKGQVDLPMSVDWPNRPRQKICHETGRPAVTDWRILRDEGETALIQMKPRTGRTHQLRVHMMALGHPILGDTLYAEGSVRDHPRLMLHAERLGLNHPVSGERLNLRSRAPF